MFEEPVFDPSKLKKKKEVKEKVKVEEQNKEEDESKPKALYTYDEMLQRFYVIHGSHEVVREKLPMPITSNEGFGKGCKTYVSNFRDIAQLLHRDPRDLLLYFNVELSGNKKGMSENGTLWIDTKLSQQQILNIVKNYIKEYVDCRTCGGRETFLRQERGLLYVICEKENCGKRSVSKLK